MSEMDKRRVYVSFLSLRFGGCRTAIPPQCCRNRHATHGSVSGNIWRTFRGRDIGGFDTFRRLIRDGAGPFNGLGRL
jgi:hypothetical protein